jgi:RHS repeat-associated protein
MVALNKTYRETLTPDRSAKDSGLRYYSPEISRWLSRDTIGARGGVNLYSFVLNSPMIWVDPTGRKVFLALTPAFFSATQYIGAYHCALVIQYWDQESCSYQIAKYEVSPTPSMELPANTNLVGVSTGTGIFAGSLASGGSSATTGGSTATTTGGPAVGSSSASASGSSGSTTGGSSGAAAAGSATAGIQSTPSAPNNMVKLFVVDDTYNNDTTYMETASGTPLGSYSLLNNNCCHWGKTVITTSGGSWPIPYGINGLSVLGYSVYANPGNPSAQGTEITPPAIPDPPTSAP